MPMSGLLKGHWNRDTAVTVEGNGELQTLICVRMARPRRCPTLSNHVVTKVADSPAKVTEELVQTVDVCDEDETSRGTLQIKLYTFYIVTATR